MRRVFFFFPSFIRFFHVSVSLLLLSSEPDGRCLRSKAITLGIIINRSVWEKIRTLLNDPARCENTTDFAGAIIIISTIKVTKEQVE